VVALVRRARPIERDSLIGYAGGNGAQYVDVGSRAEPAAAPDRSHHPGFARQEVRADELVRSVFYSNNSCLFRNALDNDRLVCGRYSVVVGSLGEFFALF
jgi:hypothetical protein